MPGGLTVVPTPIGNLEDLSERARRALESADVVACEDTRRTGLLYERLGIRRPRLVSNHEGNEADRARQLAQAIERGAKVAFLGVDVEDNDADAREFLEQYPVSFPSYKDPDLKISADLKAIAPPSTIYIDSKGDVAYIHQGAYPSEDALVEDIDRYAR